MSLIPEVVLLPALRFARFPVRIEREKIREAMGPVIREVFRVVASQGLAPTGPWFTHHFQSSGTHFDFEACVPVSEEIRPEGSVLPGSWPERKAVRGVHRGAYEGLGVSWAEFRARVASQGLMVGEGLWESYSVGPEYSPNPADWRTELYLPLRD